MRVKVTLHSMRTLCQDLLTCGFCAPHRGRQLASSKLTKQHVGHTFHELCWCQCGFASRMLGRKEGRIDRGMRIQGVGSSIGSGL